MEDRSATITLGGEDYELILTTRATKEIAKRYGGLDTLGEQLMQSDDVATALDEIVWLITLLANQGRMIHNLKNPKDQKPLLTEEMVELLTAPSDFVEYKEAITLAMNRGTKRNVESEDDPQKNAQSG
jgi:hypothetical protein